MRPRLAGPDGRATTGARLALVAAVLLALAIGFAVREGTDGDAAPAAAAPVSSEVLLADGAPAAQKAPRLTGAPALPALDRTPRRGTGTNRDAGAGDTSVPTTAAPETETETDTDAAQGQQEAPERGAAPVSTPAPDAASPPAAAPPAPAAPAPAPPAAQQPPSRGPPPGAGPPAGRPGNPSPSGQVFDSEG